MISGVAKAVRRHPGIWCQRSIRQDNSAGRNHNRSVRPPLACSAILPQVSVHETIKVYGQRRAGNADNSKLYEWSCSMTSYDPIVRIELLAVISGRSAESIKRDTLRGRIPRRDAKVDRKTAGWRLSTLMAWNPLVGRRLNALLASPYLPAA